MSNPELQSLEFTRASLEASIAEREKVTPCTPDFRIGTGEEKKRLAEVNARIAEIRAIANPSPKK